MPLNLTTRRKAFQIICANWRTSIGFYSPLNSKDFNRFPWFGWRRVVEYDLFVTHFRSSMLLSPDMDSTIQAIPRLNSLSHKDSLSTFTISFAFLYVVLWWTRRLNCVKRLAMCNDNKKIHHTSKTNSAHKLQVMCTIGTSSLHRDLRGNCFSVVSGKNAQRLCKAFSTSRH